MVQSLCSPQSGLGIQSMIILGMVDLWPVDCYHDLQALEQQKGKGGTTSMVRYGIGSTASCSSRRAR